MIITSKKPIRVKSETTSWMVVGDVHGQWDAYRKLLDIMGKTASGPTRNLITLGDLVDKGPNSIQCIKATLGEEAKDRSGASKHFRFWGNHEIMMVEAIRSLGMDDFEDRMRVWRGSGVDGFLDEAGEGGGDRERVARLIDKIGIKNLAKFTSWHKMMEVDGLRFTHAGYCPDVGWTETSRLTPEDLWKKNSSGHYTKHLLHWASIRKPFLDYHGRTGSPVVFHGHSIPSRLYKKSIKSKNDVFYTFSKLHSHNRICLDGGAGKNKGITGCLVENGKYRLFYSPVK